MPTLNIGGKRVKVDDSFLSLTPEQQNATVEEIASSFKPKDQSKHREFDGSSIPGYDPKTGEVVKTGAGEAFGLGASDMATWGVGDEISASLASGSLFGANDGLWGDYDKTLSEMRALQDRAAHEHPVATGAGMVTGAVGSGLGLAKAGLTFTGNLGAKAGLAARTAASAKDGAVMGGVYGAGSGEGVGDRLKQGVGGAVAGGVIGGAIPGIVAGVKGVAKPITDAVGARTNPEAFAARKVAERLGASNMTPNTVANKMANNPGSAVADVAGKSARDLLRTTVNLPGPAKDRVAKQVAMRQFGQGDRLKTAIGRTFADPDGYLNAKDDLASMAKSQATPLYQKAYARPVHFSQDLEDILNTPAGKSALAKAEALAANEQQPFKHVFVNVNNVAKRVPDTRGWDYIKRAMDDMIDAQTDDITRKVTNEGRILVSLKNKMLAEIDRYNPDYKAARGLYAGIAQIDNSLEFGRKSLQMSPEAVKREIAKMSATQKEAARVGAAEELRKAIDAAGYTNNAILRIFNSRQRVQNIRSLFDNDRQFAEFRKAIFQEARKRSTYEAVRGNSTTASQLADMFEAGGSSEIANFAGRAVTQGPVSATIQWVGSALRRLGGLTPKVADEIAKRLMSASPAETRAIVNELMKIERMQVSAAQKSALVQQLVSRVLTTAATTAQAR
jgi:hypothetical protein